MVANDHIDLTVEGGEIHGLLGENGAGKSTLMNILYGLYSADEGEIRIDGERVHFDGPGDAIDAGIGMVHQHFMLVPVFTVTENIILGQEPTRAAGTIDRRTARRRVAELSEQFGLPVDPDAIVEELPVGVQQRVEILKALVRDADVLILDEPTAVLTPPEIDDLFEAMRALKASGKSIVFITHKLREVREICDRISVLRNGEMVGTAEPDTSESDLAAMMVGREVLLVVDRDPPREGEPVLQVEDLVVENHRGAVAVDHVTFDVRAGEILAIAGVEGNGQTELVEAITGLNDPIGGAILLDGTDIVPLGRKQALAAGIGHVPEDRSRDGLVGGFTVAENLVLDMYRDEPYSSGLALRNEVVRSRAAELVEDFDVRTPSIQVPASTLSGGNQQKVVVAREFARPTALFVAHQPTRGVDVGSIEYIHRRLVDKRDEGTAVLIVSSELDEVLALGDRIAVMFRGKLYGPFPGDISRDQVGLLMAGAAPEQSDVAAADRHAAAGPEAGDDAEPHPGEQSGDGHTETVDARTRDDQRGGA